MNLDDFLDTFNWIDRIEGLTRGLMTFLPHRDLRGHWRNLPAQEDGHLRLKIDGGWREMRIERHDQAGAINQTGGEAQRLLKKFGVPVFGRRVTHNEFIFSVPLRQANWAEYLLATHFRMAASHDWHNPENAVYAARRGGRSVPAWQDQKEVTG